MRHQLTENETWVLALLFIVFQPMVANKTGRYSLAQISEQFKTDEQPRFEQGIEALVEMGMLVMDGKDICITKSSEGLVKTLEYMGNHSEDEFQETLRTDTALASILDTINNDKRFAPPPPLNTTPKNENITNEIVASATKGMSLGEKIFYSIFVILVLMGLLKVFVFRPLGIA